MFCNTEVSKLLQNESDKRAIIQDPLVSINSYPSFDITFVVSSKGGQGGLYNCQWVSAFQRVLRTELLQMPRHHLYFRLIGGTF